MARDGGDLIKVTSNSSSSGMLTLINTAVDIKHLPFPASLDGKSVSYRIDHVSASGEFELGEGVYTHSGTTLTRPTANVVHGTAGVGANTDFSPGGLIVTVTPKWKDISDLIARVDGVQGGGATINEVPSGPAAYQFVAGGAFTVDGTDRKQRSLKIMGVADGALTANMQVTLPSIAGMQEGDEIYVEKGEASTFTVTVSGFDVSGTGTHTLRRQDQFIIAKVTGKTAPFKWERQRGGQQAPSAAGQDLMRAASLAAAQSLLEPVVAIVTSGPYAASNHEQIPTDSSGGSFDINLWVAVAGDWLEVVDATGSWGINPVTLVPQGGDTIAAEFPAAGDTSFLDLNGGKHIRIIYDGISNWYIANQTGPDEVPSGGVQVSGTPTANQLAGWVNATTVQGVSIVSADAGNTLVDTPKYWVGTQTAYDAIGTPDTNTVYFILE